MSSLPIEIQQHIIQTVLDDLSPIYMPEHCASALAYCTISRALHETVVSAVYRAIHVVALCQLSTRRLLQLADLLEKKPSLARRVQHISITTHPHSPSGAYVHASRLLALCQPTFLLLDVPAGASILLARVHTTRLSRLELLHFDGGHNELDSLTCFLARASANLRSLRLPTWFPVENAAFEEEALPTCPNLKSLQSAWIGTLQPSSEDEASVCCDISYYRALIERHTDTLENLGIAPLQIKHNVLLSQITRLPKLESVTMEDFAFTFSEHGSIKNTFEFRLMQDLALFPSIAHIQFLPRRLANPTGNSTDRLHLAAVQCCIVLLQRWDWLPGLATIEFGGLHAGPWQDTTSSEGILTSDCLNAISDLYRVLKSHALKRGLKLLGAFSRAMENTED